MNDGLVPRALLDFLLYEVQDAGTLTRHPRFAAHSRESFDAVLEAARQLALARFANHARDPEWPEPRLVDGEVQLPAPVQAALDAYADAGFPRLLADEGEGGLQLPYTLALACDALFCGANVSTTGYALLARGVANLLQAHATPAQQARYRTPILEGRALGTMCLSEPQAGSSLGDISTRAEPHADGHYRLTGAKMWISGGEHALAANIVHMVLARLPDAPPGVRGISLFVVPKHRVDAEGRPVARNDVRCAGLNHKLGQRGIVNTFLKFGEQGDCFAELVGQPHQGLAQMFHLMNEARIGVGVGAIALGHAGFRYSAAYARERRQGRPPDARDPAAPPVPIIEHADVRRMLLQQKAWTEGALGLALFAAGLVDEQAQQTDPARRAAAARLLDLLTPVVKAWPAEWCTRANDLAIQVLGGYGYTRDYPVEQFWRDNRLNPIHEGTNGIQALDLLGRKVFAAEGAALRDLLAQIEATAADCSGLPALREHAASLRRHAALLADTTGTLARHLAGPQARAALANAPRYLTLLGHVAVAWTWLRMARAALRRGAAAEDAFVQGLLGACRWFFVHELPAVAQDAALLAAADATALGIAPEALD